MTSSFTTDLAAVAQAVQSAHAGGDTALIDTIHLGLNQMRWARRPRRALLILSDGMDNHSRNSRQELIREALEADAQVYSVILDDGPATRKPIELTEARRGWSLFEELAEKTGGLHYRVRNASEAKAAAAKAGAALRNECVIGYQTPGPVGSGKWRRIRVKTEIPGARVSARNGYYCR
jgi:Ca-activated chloride channel homolog